MQKSERSLSQIGVKVRKLLKVKRSAGRSFRQETGDREKEGTPSPGILYEYQKKGVGRKGIWKSVKEKELEIAGDARCVRIGLAYTRQSSIDEL